MHRLEEVSAATKKHFDIASRKHLHEEIPTATPIREATKQDQMREERENVGEE
jgi:hypothetical protein